MAVEIHNGQIIEDGKPVEASSGLAPQPKVKSEPHFDPNEIAQMMAKTVSEAQSAGASPMEIVNRLLLLKHPLEGWKVVWTRWDVQQAFKLWASKVEGRSKS